MLHNVCFVNRLFSSVLGLWVYSEAIYSTREEQRCCMSKRKNVSINFSPIFSFFYFLYNIGIQNNVCVKDPIILNYLKFFCDYNNIKKLSINSSRPEEKTLVSSFLQYLVFFYFLYNFDLIVVHHSFLY